ncbi:MAG: pyruvate-binding protein, partial [Pseudomonadota bacterium]
MNRFTTSIAAALLLVAPVAGHALTSNLVTNGSFENFTGTLNGSGWNHLGSNAIDGWVGDPNVEIQTQPTLGLTPQDGSHYIELDTSTNATISQSLTLDAGNYMLSF